MKNYEPGKERQKSVRSRPARQVLPIHTSSSPSAVPLWCVRLLPTSLLLRQEVRLYALDSTHRRAGVCDQCVALAPVVMVTVRATHSETNDPPRSCVSACLAVPRALALALHHRQGCVRACLRARSRSCVRMCDESCMRERAYMCVRIQVEVFRNALEALYEAAEAARSPAFRMISFFFFSLSFLH